MKFHLGVVAGLVLSFVFGPNLWGQSSAPPKSDQAETRSVWDGVFTGKQAERGQQSYEKQCSSCHADTLAGGESAPPLAGGEFLSNWNDLTVGDLFERIRTSMPLNKPGSLKREINADIVAYILSFNNFPAGEGELPHDAQMLKLIRLEMNKSAHSHRDR
jgi:mono/diheme cytochrome c family protein